MPACKNVLGIIKIYLTNGDIFFETNNKSLICCNKINNYSFENLKIERKYDCYCQKEGMYTVYYYYYYKMKYTYIILLKNICITRANIITTDSLLLIQLDLLYGKHGQFLLEHREHCQYIDEENQSCIEWSTLLTTDSITKKVCKYHKEENIFYTVRQQHRIKKSKKIKTIIDNENTLKNINSIDKKNNKYKRKRAK